MTVPAIYYVAESYSTNMQKLMGRNAAGEGFLKGMARYSDYPELACYAHNQQGFAEFSKSITAWSDNRKKSRFVPIDNFSALSECSTLFYPSPGVDKISWLRRRINQRSYSICGITHTISSDKVLDTIGNIVTSPVQAWDALICTSTVAKKSINHIIDNYSDYLVQRFGIKADTVQPKLQLPIIPLGVHVDDFASTPATKQKNRTEWRKKLGIAADDFVVLFFGRLSFHAKAHPYPMYVALENAAKQTGRKIHLIQAGWFANQSIENAFKECARDFCPSVNCIYVDGRDANTRVTLWNAADIFCSLSDSFQETFGLTPIEAMASGLPCLVSDWDGYKDTIVHGETGFRARTTMPKPGNGDFIMTRYELELDNYDIYTANTGLCVVVDIADTTKHLVELINNSELRLKMASNAEKRAREIFDWRVVIKQYEELWRELDKIRLSAPEVAAYNASAGMYVPPNPMRDCPFNMFSSFSTEFIDDEAEGVMASDNFRKISQHISANYGMMHMFGRLPEALKEAIKRKFL